MGYLAALGWVLMWPGPRGHPLIWEKRHELHTNELEQTIAALLMLQEGIPETAEAARELIKRFSQELELDDDMEERGPEG